MSLSVDLDHAFPGFTLRARFDAPPGVTVLFGRSGSGKSTVVNAVAGLLRPDRGAITLDGETLFDAERGLCLPPHRRRIGCVFQEARLFPHMTVTRNLTYGRRFARGTGGPFFDDVVTLLGIGALLDRRPATLSGGERQRVAIGRALLARPRLLAMDEPLASLDAPRKAEILPYLERLRDLGVPILYVTHSMAEVARLATTLVVLDEGRLRAAGPTETLLSDPALAPVMGLREAGAILRGRVAAQHADGLTEIAVSAGRLLLPGVDAETGAAVRVRIEAQDVMLATARPEGLSALNILPVEITALHEGGGPGVMVQLRAGEELLLARITRRSAAALELAPGRQVWAVLKSVAVAQADVGAG